MNKNILRIYLSFNVWVSQCGKQEKAGHFANLDTPKEFNTILESFILSTSVE